LFPVAIILCYLFAKHRGEERGDATLKGGFGNNNLRSHSRNDWLSRDNNVELILGDLEMGGRVEVFDILRSRGAEAIFKGKSNEVLSGDISKDGEKMNEQKKYNFDTSHILFHKYHKGKSGKIVEEMLMAHAYIYQQNATYGGCCGSKTVNTAVHGQLLEAIGLKDVLKFSCPNDFENDQHTRRSVIPRDYYTSNDVRVWTPEYVDCLRSLLVYPSKQYREYTIVVHMLRGDTSPCKPKQDGFYRYLPNFHYQALIDEYMQPNARVIIYTSPKSFEDMSVFRRRGYEVNTDAPLKDTWKAFVTADVLVMSRSDLTMVPAMVAKGKVIYTPFWHHSLRRWKRVNKKIMEQTEKEIERLRRNMCHSARD
jgi:hypothetical protein